MSKTVPVGFAGRELWAYDVSLSILLAEVVQVGAEEPTEGGRLSWLPDVLETLRRHAVLGANAYLDLELGLDSVQRAVLLDYFVAAGRRLRRRDTITAAEARKWHVVDDRSVLWRGEAAVKTAPIADLADALKQLAEGKLPPTPAGKWWYFGLPDGPHTIAMRPEGTGP